MQREHIGKSKVCWLNTFVFRTKRACDHMYNHVLLHSIWFIMTVGNHGGMHNDVHVAKYMICTEILQLKSWCSLQAGLRTLTIVLVHDRSYS